MGSFPQIMESLPEADVPIPGVTVRLLRGPTASAIFWEAHEDTAVPEHSHGGQWGIVIEGEMELTVGGRSRVCRRGDEYFVPAGVAHSAKLRAGLRVIDFFDDPDRYRSRTAASRGP